MIGKGCNCFLLKDIKKVVLGIQNMVMGREYQGGGNNTSHKKRHCFGFQIVLRHSRPFFNFSFVSFLFST